VSVSVSVSLSVSVSVSVALAHGPKGAGILKGLEYVKAFSMAAYVSCDHLVWAGQVGALSNDTFVMRNARRISFGGKAIDTVAPPNRDVRDMVARPNNSRLSLRMRNSIIRRTETWRYGHLTTQESSLTLHN